MIIQFITDYLFSLYYLLFSPIHLPDIPVSLENTLFSVIDLIFQYGGGLLGVFVRIRQIRLCCPLV